jgi:Ca2+-binding EF-hand superfamily protein
MRTATRRFDALDADEDGTVTRDEMRAHIEAERARRASDT